MKARLPQGYGGGPGNIGDMIKQAQKAQEAMAQKQEELNAKEYTATAGGGMVSAVVSGEKRVIRLDIRPEVIDPEDAEMMADMIAAAVNEALRLAEEDAAGEMQKITGGLGM